MFITILSFVFYSCSEKPEQTNPESRLREAILQTDKCSENGQKSILSVIALQPTLFVRKPLYEVAFKNIHPVQYKYYYIENKSIREIFSIDELNKFLSDNILFDKIRSLADYQQFAFYLMKIVSHGYPELLTSNSDEIPGADLKDNDIKGFQPFKVIYAKDSISLNFSSWNQHTGKLWRNEVSLSSS